MRLASIFCSSRAFSTFNEAEAIVTNPPFKNADEFIRRGIHHFKRPTIVLLRLMALEGASRSDLIDRHLVRVWAGVERLPQMHREGWDGPRTSSSGAPFAWFVFSPDDRGSSAIEFRRMSSPGSRFRRTSWLIEVSAHVVAGLKPMTGAEPGTLGGASLHDFGLMLKGQCERKAAHDCLRKAFVALAALKRKAGDKAEGVEPYRCRFCGKFHLGHVEASSRRKHPARQDAGEKADARMMTPRLKDTAGVRVWSGRLDLIAIERRDRTRAGVSHERARFDLAMALVRAEHHLSPALETEVAMLANSLDRKASGRSTVTS